MRRIYNRTIQMTNFGSNPKKKPKWYLDDAMSFLFDISYAKKIAKEAEKNDFEIIEIISSVDAKRGVKGTAGRNSSLTGQKVNDVTRNYDVGNDDLSRDYKNGDGSDDGNVGGSDDSDNSEEDGVNPFDIVDGAKIFSEENGEKKQFVRVSNPKLERQSSREDSNAHLENPESLYGYTDRFEEDSVEFAIPKDHNAEFFLSLLPDLKKLSVKRQRDFKEIVLCTLHKFIDEEEEQTLRTD